MRKTGKTDLSAARKRYLQQQNRYIGRVKLCRVALLVGFFVLWEVAASFGWIDPFIFSQPSRIAETVVSMWQQGLLGHILVTVGETLAGFLLGAVIGCALAVLLWFSPFLSRVSEPYLVVLNSLPKIALGPVIIVVAGAGVKAIVLMALAISLIVTVLEMQGGFGRTDAELIRMARTFGASRVQIFRYIVFPFNIPTLFASLKVNIGLSLVGVIAGEFLVSGEGLGYLIVYGGQVFRLDLVMSGVLILTVVAALMYEGVVLLQRLVMRHYRY